MKKSVTYLLIFCAILFSYARGGAENQGKDQSAIILTGGNIWDGKAEKLLGTMEILVKDGKIVEMGKSVSRPKGAKIIDLSGHTVTPGFMDCHVHMTCDPDNFVPSMLTKSATSQVLFSLRGLRDVRICLFSCRLRRFLNVVARRIFKPVAFSTAASLT